MMESFFTTLWPAMSWVLFASAKSIVVIAAIFLFRLLLKSWLSAKARHGLWFAVIASLAMPVGFQVDTNIFANLALPQKSPVQTRVNADVLASLPTQVRSLPSLSLVDSSTVTEGGLPTTIAATGKAIPIVIWITAVWMSMALLLFVITLRNQLRCARLISAAQPIDRSMLDLFERCKEQLHLRRTVRFMQSPTIESPAVFGWWTPTLLVPSGLAPTLTANELRYVFLHELAHVQRRDVLINWIAAMAQIVHWFNPFVWIALRAMRADMEQACDAKVMGLLNERERIGYGNTLIRLTEQLPGPMRLAPAVAIVENHVQLKARINMIKEFDPKRIGYSALAAGLLAAVSTVAFTQPKATAVVAPVVAVTSVAAVIPAKAVDAGVNPTVPMVAQATPGIRLAQAPKPKKEASAEAAGTTPAAKPDNDGIPLTLLIENVARQTKKSFVVDARLKNVRVSLIGQKPDQVSYPMLLSILRGNNATAVETNGLVNVIPVAEARWMPLPLADANSDFPDDQWVSRTYSLRGVCAMSLLPILRPLVPQYAHFAIEVSTNSLLLVDTFGNSKRIGKIIEDMESRATGKCEQRPAQKNE